GRGPGGRQTGWPEPDRRRVLPDVRLLRGALPLPPRPAQGSAYCRRRRRHPGRRHGDHAVRPGAADRLADVWPGRGRRAHRRLPGQGRLQRRAQVPVAPPMNSLAPVAVVGAMAEEVQRLRAALEGGLAQRAGPYEVTRGRIEGVDVLLAECGIGKVNAAALTQYLLSMGAGSVIFTGVAGALDPQLCVGDVVIGSEAVQHDVDVTALGYAPGEVPGSGTTFVADPRLVRLAT